jgi:hypothetical protein
MTRGIPVTGLRHRQLKGNLYRIYTPHGSFDVERDELWREMDAYSVRVHKMPFDFDKFSQNQVREIRRQAVARLVEAFYRKERSNA